jgi:probable selenium-dependent hydroxylase accessory protein YqeC
MRLSEALLPLLPDPGTGGVIALVGAGGKTRALFALGEALSARGQDVVLTTTTHVFDPRLEPERVFDQVVLDPAYAGSPAPGADPASLWEQVPSRPDRGRRLVLASSALPAEGKLRGIAPAWVDQLAGEGIFVLVEADGSRGKPVKAPGAHEPVIPAATQAVLGLVGLDCLGCPMDDTTVHRPERFGAVTGCAPGAPIHLSHLAALIRSPRGLFKGTPAEARRVLLLNKADRCPRTPTDLLHDLCAAEPPGVDLILVCALGDPDPAKEVLAQVRPTFGSRARGLHWEGACRCH